MNHREDKLFEVYKFIEGHVLTTNTVDAGC